MPAPHATWDGESPPDLGFYHLLHKLKWPGSFLGRLMLVCGVTLSTPLLLVLALAHSLTGDTGEIGPKLVLAVLGAELIGIGLTLAAMRGALAPLRLSIAALDAYRRNGRVPELPGFYEDEPGRLMKEIHRTIASVESVHADLIHRAETDPLTEIANRRRLLRHGAEALNEARRSGASLSVVFLDIDRFKTVNDTYGHAAGDSVLRMVADLVTNTLRKGDAVARIGGEEFAILMPGSELAAAVAAAEQLRQALATLPMPALGGASITASFGVTAAIIMDDGIEMVLHRADGALYDAKRSGRNRVAYRSAGDADGDFDSTDSPNRFPIAGFATRTGGTKAA